MGKLSKKINNSAVFSFHRTIKAFLLIFHGYKIDSHNKGYDGRLVRNRIEIL